MPPTPRSDESSSTQNISLGVLGLLLAALQYKSIRQADPVRTRTYELDAIESEVCLTFVMDYKKTIEHVQVRDLISEDVEHEEALEEMKDT